MLKKWGVTMAEYVSMTKKGNYEICYEICFKTKNYEEHKEIEELARKIIDRNNQKLCENNKNCLFASIDEIIDMEGE